MPTIDLGKIQPINRGAYNNAFAYEVLDIVTYLGGTYITKRATTGNLPTNTTYWSLIAELNLTDGSVTEAKLADGAVATAKLAAGAVTIAKTTGIAAANALSVYTTGGTSTAYTLAPTPAITAYTAGQSFFVNFNAASGASPTLAISGVATPPNLVKQNPDGTFTNIAANDIPSGHRSRVTLISTTQALVEKLPNAGPTVQVFTASGTYTKPTGVRRIRVRVVGGGGGGGGVALGNSAAGGGGGGGYSEKFIDATVITTVAVTVGAAGAAGSSAGGQGGTGGTSSFGAYCSAIGGQGGDGGAASAGVSNGGVGGSGSSGDINVYGQPGTANFANTASGGGGSSVLGGGGRGVNNSLSPATGNAYGGGGAGAGNNSGANAGGTGAAGVVIIEEFY